MKSYLFLLTVLFSVQSYGQINLLSIDRLDQRMQAGKDTVFVVNFWATWCAPCVEELPYFDRLSRENMQEKLKVILVSVDFNSSKDEVFKFTQNQKIINEVFLLDEPDQQLFINRIDPGWTGAIPATLIIKNQTRKFFEKEFTYAELLNEYLKINKL